MSAPVTPVDALLGPPIDALTRAVFFRVQVLGLEVEALVLLLAGAMLFFTVWLGLPQLRLFAHGAAVARGRFHDPTAPGVSSHFAALSTALSGTVGLGNIAGVAIAITAGGPGAAFWMFIIGFFAMALKMAEVTLGLKYRLIDAKGDVFGGPMYTLARGFAGRNGLKMLGIVLGGCYAFAALGGALPMLQTNQSFEQVASVIPLRDLFGEEGARWSYGIAMAAAVAVVVLGSAHWLGAVTSRLVPVMCGLYLLAGLVVIVGNLPALPGALGLIVTEAFRFEAAAGGAVGAFIVGMRRAVYSCEAGVGSAVMAHTLAKTREPVSEGAVALLEPFVDTVIVCSMTALVVVITGAYRMEELAGVGVTSAAFADVLPWFPVVLAVAVALFAYSTLISWGYYGVQAWGYLFGRSQTSIQVYKLFYCVMIPLGAVLPLGKVVDFIDSCFFLMAIPNIVGLLVLSGELRRDVADYVARVARPAAKVGRSANVVELEH